MINLRREIASTADELLSHPFTNKAKVALKLANEAINKAYPDLEKYKGASKTSDTISRKVIRFKKKAQPQSAYNPGRKGYVVVQGSP